MFLISFQMYFNSYSLCCTLYLLTPGQEQSKCTPTMLQCDVLECTTTCTMYLYNALESSQCTATAVQQFSSTSAREWLSQSHFSSVIKQRGTICHFSVLDQFESGTANVDFFCCQNQQCGQF